MPDLIVLLLAASATALATGIDAVPAFFLGRRTARLSPALTCMRRLPLATA